MAAEDVKDVLGVDAKLDGLDDPSSSEVWQATKGHTSRAIAAAAARRAMEGGGGPGGPTALDDLTDVDTSGGSEGDVLTQQGDGSFALEAPAGGSQSVVPLAIPIAFDDQYLSERTPMPITGVDVVGDTFTVAGDQTGEFYAGGHAWVTGSSLNDGFYLIVSVTFDTDHTDIVVEDTAISDGTVDGNIAGEAGLVIHTPNDGDLLLNVKVAIEESWDSGMFDIGTFLGSENGLFYAANNVVDMSNAPDSATVGAGMLLSSDLRDLAAAAAYNTVPVVPVPLVGGVPLKVIVTGDGTTAAISPGSSQGAATVHLLIATPVTP